MNEIHESVPMQLFGTDYITQRLGGKRCHHLTRFVCPKCQTEKTYFSNLMGRRMPKCNGKTQRLNEDERRAQ